jgi:hypothetical protein
MQLQLVFTPPHLPLLLLLLFFFYFYFYFAVI